MKKIWIASFLLCIFAFPSSASALTAPKMVDVQGIGQFSNLRIISISITAPTSTAATTSLSSVKKASTTASTTLPKKPSIQAFKMTLTATKKDAFSCQTYEWIGKGNHLACSSADNDEYTIIADEKTVLRYADKTAASSSVFRIGDTINAYGYRNARTGVIEASILRDLDELPTPKFTEPNSFSGSGLQIVAPQGTEARLNVYGVVPFLMQFKDDYSFENARDRKGAFYLSASTTTEIPGLEVTFSGCIPGSPECEPPVQTDRAFLTGRALVVGNYRILIKGEYVFPIPDCARSVVTNNFDCQAQKKAPLHVEHEFQITVRK